MKATWALIRKDRGWLALAAATGAVACTLLLFDLGMDDCFVVPSYRVLEGLSYLLPPLGALLAALQTAREPLAHTTEYVRQRSVTPLRLYWTQTIAAVAVQISWMLLAVAALWSHELLLGFGGAAADPRGWTELAAGTSLGLATHALTLFVLTLPLTWAGRLGVGGTLVVVLLGLQSLLLAFEPPLLVYAAAHGGLAVALLFLAQANACTPADPDRPLPRGFLLATVPLASAAACLLGGIAASVWEANAFQQIQRRRPWVAQISAQELALVRPLRSGVHEVLDEDRAPTGRVASGRDLGSELLAPRPAEPRFAPFDVRVLSYLRVHESLWIQGGLRHVEILPDGVVRIADLLLGGRRAWKLERPGSGAFSAQTFLDDFRADPDPDRWKVALIDPEVPGVWLIGDETPPTLVPVPLPAGERPVRTSMTLVDGERRSIVVGEQHAWELGPDGWRAVENEHIVGPLVPTLHDPDPFQPDVEVVAPNGLRLRYRYTLATGSEKLLAGLACLGTLLRPLPLALFAATQDYAGSSWPRHALWLLDPILGGGYAWLLAPNAVCALLLALSGRRELRQRGASSARATAWAVVLLLGGAFGAVITSCFETRRARRAPARRAPLPVVIRVAG